MSVGINLPTNSGLLHACTYIAPLLPWRKYRPAASVRLNHFAKEVLKLGWGLQYPYFREHWKIIIHFAVEFQSHCIQGQFPASRIIGCSGLTCFGQPLEHDSGIVGFTGQVIAMAVFQEVPLPKHSLRTRDAMLVAPKLELLKSLC